MYWSQTESASEIIDEYADDNEALVNYYKCSVCGRDYEIVDLRLESVKRYIKTIGMDNKRENGILYIAIIVLSLIAAILVAVEALI